MKRKYMYSSSRSTKYIFFCVVLISFILFLLVLCDIGQLLDTDRHADALVQAAKGLLSDERSFKRRKVLTDLLQNLEDRSDLESREEDEDWFNGTVQPSSEQEVNWLIF